ncbi:hypothetical protein BH18THE1_BH18THE1_09440 [soil metagenome]
MFFLFIFVNKVKSTSKKKHYIFYYVLEKDIPNNLTGWIHVYMLRKHSNYMSNDLNVLIARKDKLEGELHHELSADYNELMKKLSKSFRDMHENSVQYYKQKANKELDKMEKNIQLGNKLSAINEKLLADTYLSFATTI